MGTNKNNGNILVELEEELVEKIDQLVDRMGQFKSRDDFIELACHEFMVRRNPAASLLGVTYVGLGIVAIGFLQDLGVSAIALLS